MLAYPLRNREESTKSPRTHRRTLTQSGLGAANSGQASLQHTGKTACGCFRQDLTGFGSFPLSRTQPSTSRTPRLTKK